MLRLRQFWAITRLTTLDLIRQPICLLLAVVSVVLMALASMQAYQFGEDGKLVRDSSLAVYFLFGLITGGYAACTVLAREIQSGTALATLSKPVGMDLFFLAKFAGISTLILLYSACAIPACLLSEQAAPKLFRTDSIALGMLLAAPVAALALAGIANLTARRPFTSTAFFLLAAILLASLALSAALHDPASEYRDVRGHTIHVATALQWRLVPVALLITLSLFVLSALSLSMATSLNSPAVMILLGVVLALGMLSDFYFGAEATPAATIAHRILPDWQRFLMADALTGGGRVGWRYVGTAALYAVFYLAAAMAAGIVLFRRREIR